MKKIVLALVFVSLFAIGVHVALSADIYIPIVYRAPATLIPTLVPTPTQTPIPGPILLPNGDFEQGQTIWHEYSNFGYDIIRHQDELRITPHSGEWAAWLGGNFNTVEQIDQWVVVPASHPYLSFWLWILSTDTCTHDFAFIHVGYVQIDKHDLCYDHNTDGWAQKVYDLSAYSGQNINLIISIETDATYMSTIFLDDFEFLASPTP